MHGSTERAVGSCTVAPKEAAKMDEESLTQCREHESRKAPFMLPGWPSSWLWTVLDRLAP